MKPIRNFTPNKLHLSIAAISILGALPVAAETLIWSDEFNDGTLNQQIWNIETGTGINGNWGTGQLDRATERPDNLDFINNVPGAEGGVLAITTRNEFYIDRDYTSGRINTEGNLAFGPGTRLEARVWARDVLYQGQGFAFWMMPNEVPEGFDYIMWPQGGEVDIMEYVGSIPFHNLATVHYAWFWEDNLYQDWNHGHLGGYYSYKDQQVPDEPEWISIELSESASIDRVVLNWEGAYGKSYKIQVSNDNINWTDIYSTTTGDGGVDDINLNGTGRYVRMYGTERATNWSYSLFEVEVYSGGNNIALNRPVTVSSTQAPDLSGELAVDGQYATRWSSNIRNPSYGNYPPAPGDMNAGSAGFHTYGVDWLQDRMEFRIDGNIYHIHYFNDGGAFAPADGGDREATQVIDGRRVHVSEFSNHFAQWSPFEHEMYLILSSGVGGDSGYTYGGGIVPEAVFPASVLVDWVRAYDLDGTHPPMEPPVEPPVEPSTNLALNKTAMATSAQGDDLAASAAFDGDANTRWSSSWNDDESITVDLGSSQAISSVVLSWEAAHALAYRIEISEDAQNWTSIYNTDASAGGVESLTNLNTNGRYVRMQGEQRATAWGYSLWEFEVYGGDDTTPPPVDGSDKALNQPAMASSEEGGYWHASNAVDGVADTRWASDASDDQWLSVDLGSVQTLSKVVLSWEGAFGLVYDIQVSDDNTNWTTVQSVTNGDGGMDEIVFTATGRYVRMLGKTRATGYGYSLYSFEVY